MIYFSIGLIITPWIFLFIIGTLVVCKDFKYYKYTLQELIKGNYIYNRNSSLDQVRFINVTSDDEIIFFRDGSIKLATGNRYKNSYIHKHFMNPYGWYWGYKIRNWKTKYFQYSKSDRSINPNLTIHQSLSDIFLEVSDKGLSINIERIFFNKKNKVASLFPINKKYIQSVGVGIPLSEFSKMEKEDQDKSADAITECYNRIKRMNPEYELYSCPLNEKFYIIVQSRINLFAY